MLRAQALVQGKPLFGFVGPRRRSKLFELVSASNSLYHRPGLLALRVAELVLCYHHSARNSPMQGGQLFYMDSLNYLENETVCTRALYLAKISASWGATSASLLLPRPAAT